MLHSQGHRSDVGTDLWVEQQMYMMYPNFAILSVSLITLNSSNSHSAASFVGTSHPTRNQAIANRSSAGNQFQNTRRRKRTRTKKVLFVRQLIIDRHLQTQGDVQNGGIKLAEIPGISKTSGRELPLPQRGSNSATHLDGKYLSLLVEEMPPELSSISITIDLTWGTETDNVSVLGTPSGLFKKTIEGSVKTLDAAPSTSLLSNEVAIATVTVAGTVGAVGIGTSVANAISAHRSANAVELNAKTGAAEHELHLRQEADKKKDTNIQDSGKNNDSPEEGGNPQEGARAPDQSSAPATQNTPAQSSTAGGKETPSTTPRNLKSTSANRNMPTKPSAVASSSTSKPHRVTQTAPRSLTRKQKNDATLAFFRNRKELEKFRRSKQKPASPVSSSTPGLNMARFEEINEREKVLSSKAHQLIATHSNDQAAASGSANNKSTPSADRKGKGRDCSITNDQTGFVDNEYRLPEPDDFSIALPSTQIEFPNKHERGGTSIEMNVFPPCPKKSVEEGQVADTNAAVETTIHTKECSYNESSHNDDEKTIKSPVMSSQSTQIEPPQLSMDGNSNEHLVARGPIGTPASDIQPHTLLTSSTSNEEVHSSPLVEDEHHVETAVPATSTNHINTQHSSDNDHPLTPEEARTKGIEHCDRDVMNLQASDATQEPDLYSSEA